MLGLCMNAVYVKDDRVYLKGRVKNTNSSVIFGISSVSFRKCCDYNGITLLKWNTIFCVYIF